MSKIFFFFIVTFNFTSCIMYLPNLLNRGGGSSITEIEQPSTPATPTEPPVPAPTPLVLGSNLAYMYNYPTDGKISRINYLTNSTSEVAQVANEIYNIGVSNFNTVLRNRTASATAEYFTENNTYKTYRFDYGTENLSEVGSFGTYAEPYTSVSDESILIQDQTTGTVYYSSPTVSATPVASAFNFANDIGTFPYYVATPLGRNYFIALHNGSNANKFIILNGNNMTYSPVVIPDLVTAVEVRTFNTTTTEGFAMVYLIYNNGTSDVDLIYLFNQATGTLTLIDSHSPSQSFYDYDLLPLRNGNIIYTKSDDNNGDYSIFTINTQTASASLSKKIVGTADTLGHLANNNCPYLQTNRSMSRLYVVCISGTGFHVYEVNLISGALSIHTSGTIWSSFTSFAMYHDEFYLIADTDGNGTKDFKKLEMASGTVTVAATNDVEVLLQQQVCVQLGHPSNCNAVFDYSAASIYQPNDYSVSKKQAYEWMALYLVAGTPPAAIVTVEGVPYSLAAAVIHNDAVYIRTPDDMTAGGFNYMNSIVDGVVWAFGFFSNYLISNFWIDLF